ncbi:UDP-3-O-(3-hydroxymyristoyl)glucosamine N-acyltransferase [bacterium]
MITAKQIAELVDGKLVGNQDVIVSSASSIKETKKDSISFVACSKYYQYLDETKASVIITPIDERIKSSNATIIMVANPMLAFAAVLNKLITLSNNKKIGIEKTAVVDPTAKTGKDVYIGQNVVIEKGVSIGDNTIIEANTFVGQNSSIGDNCRLYQNISVREDVIIKNNVIIHSGVVIGSDGFGFVFNTGFHNKVPQIGNVVIENNVEIGANTAIDRATVGSTKIGEGTKIDNLVQIAHNVELGKNCLVCAQVGIAGSTIIGDYVTLAGQAGLVGHINIGDKAIIAAQAGVTKSVPANETVSGYPAQNHSKARQTYSLLRKLPELYKKILSLEKKTKKIT